MWAFPRGNLFISLENVVFSWAIQVVFPLGRECGPKELQQSVGEGLFMPRSAQRHKRFLQAFASLDMRV